MTRAVLPLLLALAACGPIVQIGGNAPPPQSLLTLTATAPPRPYAGPARTADTVGVALPVVPAMLQTLRVPVTTSATEVSYLAGASWAEQPARQFRRLLADTLAAAGLPVVEPAGSIAPARQLTGTLRTFGLDVSGAPQVVVRYDAQILAAGGGGTVLLRRFEAREPVASQTPVAVAAALNQAANRVAGEVAGWVRG